ncbi:MAG: quinolinate [Desulfobulbaceae bacterium]|nr:MAG: quinolinate [Desulfobulbaceae bacterium]
MPLLQPDIEEEYFRLAESEIFARIFKRKRDLAGRLLILCHHYQQDGLFQFADLVGDSLKLAREAASMHGPEFIVFCGVHFMAESADILAQKHQKVLLPHLYAGCPMADMATAGAVAMAYKDLVQAGIVIDEVTLVPVTYVNSSAAVKAFVGERGGSVCTSSNAQRVLAWALEKGEKVFFFPDEHLGRNSAIALGIPPEQICVWHRGELLGGNSVDQLRKARVLLWDGYCEVHMRFLPEHVRQFRLRAPEVQIMVHPECSADVVGIADRYGSTEAIITAVKESAAGSQWAIGTEINLVTRLQKQFPDKDIQLLAPIPCQCTTMDRNQPVNLLWLLDNLAAGKVVNQIRVPSEVAIKALKALEQMLSI